MSSVVNILIIGLRGDEHLSEINAWLKKHGHNAIVDVSQYAGGEKVLPDNILVGAFNYLDYNSFIEFLKGIKWSHETDLLFRHDDSDRFRLVRFDKFT